MRAILGYYKTFEALKKFAPEQQKNSHALNKYIQEGKTRQKLYWHSPAPYLTVGV